MNLYHYSTERFPFIKTRREQGVSKEVLEEAEHKAKKMGLPLPYVDHVSFFLEPIPKETIAAIFSNKHPFWRAGQKLYEHVIDSDDIDEKSFYRIVETPEINKFTDQFDWAVKDLTARSKYFVEMNKEMLRLGYSGYGISKMVSKCQQFIGKTEGYYIRARTLDSDGHSATQYAAYVPHLMVYPKGGVIPIKSVSLITLGSGRPPVTELLYHLSFNSNLPAALQPRQPHGEPAKVSIYTEKLPPRVSFSPSVQQCFTAIYPNISKYFEEEKYPYMDMYVYAPIGKGKRLSQDIVLQNVWDSHVTEEVCFVSSIQITRVAKIRIFNPKTLNRDNSIYTQPFNSRMAKVRFVAPIVNFDILERFSTIPVL